MTPQIRGIVYKLLSVVVMMAMLTCIKAAVEEVPAGEAVFFRSLFAIPPLVAWLAWRGEFPAGLRTKNPVGHVWRGLVGTGAMGLVFTAFGLLPLTEVVTITYAAPLFVTMFAAMFLGERVRLFRLSTLALGFAGVFVVLSPRLEAMETGDVGGVEAAGALIALFAAVLMGLAQVFVRKLVQTETTASVVFWFSIASAGLALFTAPFGWVAPSAQATALLVAAGLLGGVGQILLTSAYRLGEAGLIAPFEYASMLLAIAIGWFVFGEAPTPVVLAGAGLISLAGVLIIWRERRLGLKRGAARKAMTPRG